MKKFILGVGVFLLSCYTANCDVCKDIMTYPDRKFTLEQINECHACKWNSVSDDDRNSKIPSFGASRSRLEDVNSAWCPLTSYDYLQIELPRSTKIGGFDIQGFRNSWVKYLKFSYQINGVFTPALSMLDGGKTFRANQNSSFAVRRKFAMPVHTEIVRITPTLRVRNGCMKINLLSCDDASTELEPAAMQSDWIGGYFPFTKRCQINTRLDCKQHCAQYLTNSRGCQTCECDMNHGDENNERTFEGDIFLNERTLAIAQVRLSNNDQPDGTYSAGARHAARFQDYKEGNKYIIYYQMAARFSSSEQANFQRAFAHIAQKSCIQLKPARRSTPYYIKFIRGGGCYSPVGKQRNGNTVSIGYGCATLGVITHEIMHSLGFWHEQSRPDRDRYVTINWGNMNQGIQYNFQKQSSSAINSFNSPYDTNSLMHYGAYAFSNNNRPTITAKQRGVTLGQRNGLSTEDVKQLNAMYGCSSTGGGGGGGGTTRPPVTTRRPSPTTPGGKCIDENSNCSYWAKIGECDKNPGYMKVRCKKSCRVCSGGGGGGGGGNCKDDSEYCKYWEIFCSSNTLVQNSCKKTCNKC